MGRKKNEDGGAESGKVSRRALVKHALAAGVAGAVGAAGGTEAAPPPKPEDEITAADVAAADKLAGRAYTDAERAQMAKRLGRTRDGLKALRAYPLSETVEPATYFDPRLPGAKTPQKGKSGLRLSRGGAPRYDGNPESLAFRTVVELSRLVKARKVTSTELTRMYLERLKRLGPRLNCVVTLTEDLALKQAERADREIAVGKYRGPLHGIPWGAKDLLATRGIRTTWGAKPYEAQVLDYDATVIKRLEAAGAVLVAKLSLGELAMGDLWFGGRTRNPWQPDKGSSGSSAGPGSATAAGLVGFSIGSETLGSIVSPSVVNGVTGLRPTYGRVPRTGAMALSWTMDKLGPMCRGVEDCAVVLAAIYGPDGQDRTVPDGVPFSWDAYADIKKLRVGVNTAAFESVEKNEKRRPIYAAVLETLRALGVEPRPVTLPRGNAAYGALAGTIIDVEGAAAFAELTANGKLALLKAQEDYSWPNVFRTGSTVPAVDYLRALRIRTRLQEQMAEALKDVDLYVSVPHATSSLTYTNLTGHPAVITRCGMLDGLPQSIEFVGDLYREEAILRVAHAYEQATTWHKEWPDTEKIPPLSAGETKEE